LDSVREGCTTDYFDDPGAVNNYHPAGPFVGVTVDNNEGGGVTGRYPRICDELCAERDTHLNKIADRSCISGFASSSKYDVKPLDEEDEDNGGGEGSYDEDNGGGVGGPYDEDNGGGKGRYNEDKGGEDSLI
jgi:hypothetical protein